MYVKEKLSGSTCKKLPFMFLDLRCIQLQRLPFCRTVIMDRLQSNFDTAFTTLISWVRPFHQIILKCRTSCCTRCQFSLRTRSCTPIWSLSQWSIGFRTPTQFLQINPKMWMILARKRGKTVAGLLRNPKYPAAATCFQTLSGKCWGSSIQEMLVSYYLGHPWTCLDRQLKSSTTNSTENQLTLPAITE